MISICGKGIMGPTEALGCTPNDPQGRMPKGAAQSWTMDRAPCGPGFPGLSEVERETGHAFVTLWPSA